MTPQVCAKTEGVGGKEDVERTLGRGEVNVILKSVITRSTQRLQYTPLSESVAPKAVGAARDQI